MYFFKTMHRREKVRVPFLLATVFLILMFTPLARADIFSPTSSVLKGQPVLMADGSQKNIEDIRINDEVVSYNVGARKMEKDRVTHVLQGSHDDYLVLNGTLKTSVNHLIWANGDFMPAEGIKIGDLLLNSAGQEVKVAGKEFIRKKVETYDLTVERNHNFFASGYLVHNGIIILTQKHFKIYQDDLGLNAANQYAAEDANYAVTVGTKFRIRFEVTNTGTSPPTFARRLEFKEANGAWTQITTNSNNVRLTSSNSSDFHDGDATTTRLTPVGTFVAGQGKYAGSDTTSATLAANKYIEDEYCLQFQAGAVGYAYQFRITAGGNVFDIYDQIPTISPIAAPAAKAHLGRAHLGRGRF
jgi:hypothetical protein